MYARISAILVALALAVTGSASAQERFGGVTGHVKDQQGLPVPGVTVTVTNNETGRSAVTVTDADGIFLAPRLEPGRYGLKFELQGFATQEASNVIVLLGSTVSVESVMHVSGVAETVQVQARTSLI